MRSKLMPKGRLRAGSFYIVYVVMVALILGAVIGQASFNMTLDYRLHQLETQISPVSVDSGEEKEEVEATSDSGLDLASGVEMESIGHYKITHYCSCEQCCGAWADGITYSGTEATEGRTIAVDPNKIPLGSTVYIDGQAYVAEDIGGAIKGQRIDVYVDSHEEAINRGVITREVFK